MLRAPRIPRDPIFDRAAFSAALRDAMAARELKVAEAAAEIGIQAISVILIMWGNEPSVPAYLRIKAWLERQVLVSGLG